MEKFIYIKLFIFALLLIFPLLKEKKVRLYHPAILLAFMFFVEYEIPTLYMFINPGQDYLYRLHDFKEMIDKGLNFVILVFLFFLLGYYSPYYNKNIRNFVMHILRKVPKLSNYSLQIRNLPMVLIVLLTVGWIVRIFLFKTGLYFHAETGMEVYIPTGYKLYAQYLNIASLFPLIGLSLIFVEWLKDLKEIKYFLISLIFLVTEMLYAIPSGSKERIVFPLFILLVLYSFKHKVPIFSVSIVSVFIVLFVFPFIGIYRSIIRTGDIAGDLQFAFHIYERIFQRFDPSFLNELFIAIFGVRLNFAYIVSIIVDKTPQIWDFKMGYTYFLFFISLIPRIIWPSKPAIAGFSNDFGRDYGFLHPSDYSTSVAMGWIGEMFINFGWFGVLVAFCYGLLYQTIYSYFLRTKKITPLSLFLYSFCLYYMMRGDMFAEQFSGLLKTCVTMVFVLMPFLKKEKA